MISGLVFVKETAQSIFGCPGYTLYSHFLLILSILIYYLIASYFYLRTFKLIKRPLRYYDIKNCNQTPGKNSVFN